jgi:hypothetical protein
MRFLEWRNENLLQFMARGVAMGQKVRPKKYYRMTTGIARR